MRHHMPKVCSLNNCYISLGLSVFLLCLSSEIVKILCLTLIALTSNQLIVTLKCTNVVSALVCKCTTSSYILIEGSVVVELIIIKILICQMLITN